MGAFDCDAAEQEDLAAGAGAGNQLDRRFGQVEGLGEEGDQGLVGSAFDGRGVCGDLELCLVAFAVDTGDGGLAGTGLRADDEGDAAADQPEIRQESHRSLPGDTPLPTPFFGQIPHSIEFKMMIMHLTQNRISAILTMP